MIVIQLLQHLFHDSLAEEHGLCAHSELLTILIDRFHFLVIQIDDLPMTTHKRRLLLLEIFGINALGYILFSGHGGNDKMNISENLCKGSNFSSLTIEKKLQNIKK